MQVIEGITAYTKNAHNGAVYHNFDGKLPDAPWRIWYEAERNSVAAVEGKERILYSSDGLIFVTYDHYMTFVEVAGSDDVMSWQNGGSGNYPGELYSGTRNPNADFTNTRGNSTLTGHYNDHKKDFNFENEIEYLNGARNFLEKTPTPTIQSFTSDAGWYFRYDTATNEFGIINQYGSISTYYKPDNGLEYWLEQIVLYAPK